MDPISEEDRLWFIDGGATREKLSVIISSDKREIAYLRE
jgi:hypothetical protein